MQARLSHATRFYIRFVFQIGRLVVGKARTEVFCEDRQMSAWKADRIKPGEACEFLTAPLRARHRSICCPTAAIMSSSAARAAATAAGAIWPSPAGARMPRAIAGARFIYLRDVATGEFWSTAYQPTLRASRNATKPSSRRPAPSFASTMPASKSTPKSASRRKTTWSCGASRSPIILTSRRVIELTSYAEVVLAAPAADAAHPAFSNLFVQTEFCAHRPPFFAPAAPAPQEEKPPWLLHLMVGQGGEQGEVSCETDRARFIGRGRTLASPAALQSIVAAVQHRRFRAGSHHLAAAHGHPGAPRNRPH